MNFEKMRDKLYADSPFDLGTDADNAFRDGVDMAIELMESEYYNDKGVSRI